MNEPAVDAQLTPNSSSLMRRLTRHIRVPPCDVLSNHGISAEVTSSWGRILAVMHHNWHLSSVRGCKRPDRIVRLPPCAYRFPTSPRPPLA